MRPRTMLTLLTLFIVPTLCRPAASQTELQYADDNIVDVEDALTGRNGRFAITVSSRGDTVDPSELGLRDALTGEPCRRSTMAALSALRFEIDLDADQPMPFLRAYVSGGIDNDADPYLLVQLPDGSYRCVDDAFGTLMPVVDLLNPAEGRYAVWVGEYRENLTYTADLRLTQSPNNAPPGAFGHTVVGLDLADLPDAVVDSYHASRIPYLALDAQTGTFEGATLEPGFSNDPVRLAGSSGGQVSVMLLEVAPVNNGSCVGYINDDPDHVIMLTADFSFLDIRIEAQNSGDTTMVIVDEQGNVFCDDDGAGFPNPAISRSFAAGTYRVWIGSYSPGEYHDYTLSISQFRQ